MKQKTAHCTDNPFWH